MTRATLTVHLTAIATSVLMLGSGAHAQSDAAKAGLERAQKQADAVFSWIKLNADKGANRQPAPPPASAPAPVARKATPAPAPVMAAAPRPAPVTAAPTVSAAAPAAAPVTASIAASPEPEADLARNAMLVASASPTTAPSSPLAVAAQAAEPPTPPVEEAEVPLKLLHRVNPTIPPQMQRQTFRDAFARVKFTVAPDGQVSQVESMKATNNRLAAAAIEAVKQWRFAPIPEAREAAIEFAFNNVED